MYQKTVEKPYTKKQLASIKKLGEEIEEAKKDPNFMKVLDQFIKETT